MLTQEPLKLACLDSSSIPFATRRCTAQEVANRAAEPLGERAKQEQKVLVLTGAQELSLECDEEWTAEALGNLIKNALDHTDADGHITVQWNAAPGGVQFSVTDDGEGIPPEGIYHIFKRFYRVPGAKQSTGVGLGLPLAKEIIERQGGGRKWRVKLARATASGSTCCVEVTKPQAEIHLIIS